MKYILKTLFSLLFCSTVVAQPQVIYNVQGYSFDQQRQLFSFSAIAFEHGKVLATGSKDLLKQYPKCKQDRWQGQNSTTGIN